MNNSSPGFKNTQEKLLLRRSSSEFLYGKWIQNVTQITSHISQIPLDSHQNSLTGDVIHAKSKTPSNRKHSANGSQFFISSDDDEISDNLNALSNLTNDNPTKVHCTCDQCLVSLSAIQHTKNMQQESKNQSENEIAQKNLTCESICNNKVSSSSDQLPLSQESSLDSFDDFFKETVDSQKSCSCARSAIITPILTRDARQHNHDFTYHDCILNADELNRHFPEGKINVGVLTFNMAGRPLTGSLIDLLLPDRILFVPDVYAIGIQEFSSREPNELREWTIQIQSTIGPSHVLLHSVSTGVLHLCLFVRRDLVWFCSPPEDASQLCRPNPPSNLIRTKGAVAISLCIFGTSMLFVNCHLPAHQQKSRERLEECNRLSAGLDLPQRTRHLLTARYLSTDVSARFDVCFWFGDLNFRLDHPLRDMLEKLRNMDNTSEPQFQVLLKHDQLSAAIRAGHVFPGFQEEEILFPPTYKYLPGSVELDEQSARVPSYCDRILYRCKRPGIVQPMVYDSLRRVRASDHRPVFGTFQCKLRPGTEQVPLNAGLFQRDVYLLGMKRRQQAHERPPSRTQSAIGVGDNDSLSGKSKGIWPWRVLGTG